MLWIAAVSSKRVAQSRADFGTSANGSTNIQFYLLSTIPATTRSNSNLLNLFISHYVNMGIPIENFLLVIHGTSEQPIAQKIRELQTYGVVHLRSWCGSFNSHRKRAEYFLMHSQANVVHSWQWVVQVDSDEFLIADHTLHELVSFVKNKKVHGLALCFADRVTECGSIPSIIPNSFDALHQMFPLVCPLSRSLGIHPLLKMALFSAKYRSADHILMNHLCTEELFSSKEEYAFACGTVLKQNRKGMRVFRGSCDSPEGQAFLHHFKWYGDVVEALTERARIFRDAGIRWYKQSERFLVLWRRHHILPRRGCKFAQGGKRLDHSANDHEQECRNSTTSVD